MKYFSVARPIAPGTYPKTGNVCEICEFPEPRYLPEIGHKAWGYIDYTDRLTRDERNEYELVYDAAEVIDEIFFRTVEDTIANEIATAMRCISAMWYDYGHRLGFDEEVNIYGRYLMYACGPRVASCLGFIWFSERAHYKERLKALERAVADFLEDYPGFETEPIKKHIYEFVPLEEEEEDVE